MKSAPCGFLENSLNEWLKPLCGVGIVDVLAIYDLMPEESSLIIGASKQRKKEISTGRHLSRKLLFSQGREEAPILKSPLHAPIWPKDFIGSITHDSNLCAVAVAKCLPETDINIGIDIVNIGSYMHFIGDVSEYFSSYSEIMAFSNLAGDCVDKYLLLFSVKECAVKAISKEVGHLINLKSLSIKVNNELYIEYGEKKWRADVRYVISGGYMLSMMKVELIR